MRQTNPMNSRVNMKHLFSLLLATLLVTTIGCGQSGSKASTAKVDDAKKLNFTFQDVDGNTIDAREHFGKVVIVDMWDTWCGPCKKEIPHFIELHEKYKDQGFEMIGMAFARYGAPKVKEFGNDMKISYTNGIISPEAEKIFGRPRSIPTTFIIGKNGEIAETVVGYRPKEYFEQKIQELLKAS